jgi:hypothetical protein
LEKGGADDKSDGQSSRLAEELAEMLRKQQREALAAQDHATSE